MHEKLDILRGSVDGDGNIVAGKGFRVIHDKKGLFNIVFDKNSFSDTPTVTATAISNSANDDKTRINCVIQRDGLSAEGFTMITGDDDGDLSSRWFGFVAVGPGGVSASS